MTHDWNDFYDGQDPELGPKLPLTSGQQVQLVSGVLPSGESNFFDLEQDRQKNDGSGINRIYDYARENVGSGVIATYPQDSGYSIVHSPSLFGDYKPSGLTSREYESGIFHFNGSSGIFSSGYFIPSGFDIRFQKYIRPTISPFEPPRPDYAFRVMDSYIHHKTYPSANNRPIEIKFIEDFDAAIDFNRYDQYTPNANGFFDAGFTV